MMLMRGMYAGSLLVGGEAVKTHNRFGRGWPRWTHVVGSELEMDAADAARWDCLLVLHCRYMYDDDDDAGARVDEADARNQAAQFSVGNHHPPARQTRMICSFPSPGLLVCRGFCDAV